ncbi:MAG: hypothetical protein HY260_04955 [Chloroflexi bacterium]|nr:hypothetical protein [Chloroflexota bacterium]
MNKLTPQAESRPRSAPSVSWPEQGRRVRWERDPDDPEQIIIRDAVTGDVLAVVRSLFDPWAS